MILLCKNCLWIENCERLLRSWVRFRSYVFREMLLQNEKGETNGKIPSTTIPILGTRLLLYLNSTWIHFCDKRRSKNNNRRCCQRCSFSKSKLSLLHVLFTCWERKLNVCGVVKAAWTHSGAFLINKSWCYSWIPDMVKNYIPLCWLNIYARIPLLYHIHRWVSYIMSPSEVITTRLKKYLTTVTLCCIYECDEVTNIQ